MKNGFTSKISNEKYVKETVSGGKQRPISVGQNGVLSRTAYTVGNERC